MIENVIGILASRWRIYRKPIIASLPTIEAIVKATVCLHKWVMIFQYKTTDDNKRYCPQAAVDREDGNETVINGERRNETENRSNLIPIHKASSNMDGKKAKIMRERLTSYFMFEGAVPFQWNK
ncbi:hypothetical protein JTB14_016386 [Gonioctena quinquepunctata]|nr:hypothetical protein JTB14_016386 [Gonioctena quinquepunctata]